MIRVEIFDISSLMKYFGPCPFKRPRHKLCDLEVRQCVHTEKSILLLPSDSETFHTSVSLQRPVGVKKPQGSYKCGSKDRHEIQLSFVTDRRGRST